MALSDSHVSRLSQPKSELFTKIMEKGGDPASYLSEIFAVEALKANRLLGTDEMAAWLAGEDLDDPEKISAREVSVGSFGGIVLDDFNHASAYNIEAVARVAGAINCLSRPEMPGLRKLT
jgi:hypothetical protein